MEGPAWSSASVEQVQAAMERALPDRESRTALLAYLADAIEYTHERNPVIWRLAFNGKDDHLRLVSGWNVTVLVDRRGVTLRTIGALLSDDERALLVPYRDASERYESQESIDVFIIPPRRSAPLIAAARNANHAAIRLSTETISKPPKGYAHSPGAIAYIEEVLGQTLPQPLYLTSPDEELAEARSAIEAAYPDPEIRRLILNTLADSIELAEKGVAGSWTLTFLRRKNLRLTVGPNSTFYIGEHDRLAPAPVSFSIDSGVLSGADVELAEQLRNYTFNRPVGAISITIPVDSLSELLPRFLPAHHALIEQTRSQRAAGGAEPRLALTTFIECETGRALPRPPAGSPRTRRGAAAEMAMEQAYPNSDTRQFVLNALADTIELAHEGNPQSWSLSMQESYLRLNVGNVEAIMPGAYKVPGESSLTLAIDIDGVSSDEAALFESLYLQGHSTYKSRPSARRIRIAEDRLLELWPRVLPAHNRLITAVSTGRTRWPKSHSSEALEYVRKATNRALPDLGSAAPARSARFWKISVGPKPSRLEDVRRLGIIGMEFDHLAFDLSDLPGEALDAYLDALVERGLARDTSPNRAPMQLWMFRSEMHPGDSVYLYTSGSFHSRGVVTGGYTFEPDATIFPHRRTVDWNIHGQVALESLPSSLSGRIRDAWSTLEVLTEDEADRIDALMAGEEEIAGEETDPGPDIPWQQTYARLFPAAGLHYTPWQQAVFFTALQSKGFVILSGISGTGKTKIAQAFTAALPEPESGKGRNVEFLTVRPDWRDSKSLIGYHNPISDRYEWTPFLRFLLQAVASWERRDGLAWFVILDEMNLAHVEHYFAELLSVLESGRDDDGWTIEAVQITATPEEDGPPASVRLPPNLFLIGTVNLDETTHAFSPKVLDRAFAMEFSDVSFEQYAPAFRAAGASLTSQERRTLLDALSSGGAFPRINRAAIAALLATDDRPRRWLESLNRQLRPHHMHFGYRVFDEIMAFVDLGLKNGLFTTLTEDDDPLATAFDAAVLMKVLPKFHGSRARLEGPLTKVLAWCLDPEIPDLYAVNQCIEQASNSDALEHRLRDLTYRFPQTADRTARLLWTTYVDGFAAFG